MPIPEANLETWSHQGSITQSSTTYNSIKDVLKDRGTPYAGRNFEVFLQGSYGNDTNIYAESDVDIVVRLDDCFYSNANELPEGGIAAYDRAYSGATYTLAMFKQQVLGVLNAAYGPAVHAGAKAVAIDGSGSRRKADVIVSSLYHRYSHFNSSTDYSSVEGICFFNSAGEQIVNYPRQHSENMTRRHQALSNSLKPLVRIFKNIRSRLVERGAIEAGIAPSYYIEALLYNAPNTCFAGSYADSVPNILNWFTQDADKNNLVCANEQYYLLRDGFQVCWPLANCEAFIRAAVSLWNVW